MQYKELKHSKARNDQGTWHPQLEQVRHSFRSTAWSLKDGSSQELPVIDAHSADYLYMPLAGTTACHLPYMLCEADLIKCKTLARQTHLLQWTRLTMCCMSCTYLTAVCTFDTASALLLSAYCAAPCKRAVCHALAGEVYIDADAAEASNTTASRIAMRTMDALQGFKVLGTQKQEKALPIGTDLTVVGEVVSTQPVCSCPI